MSSLSRHTMLLSLNAVSMSIFLFKQKTAYGMRISDWSADVCSSGLLPGQAVYTPATLRIYDAMVLGFSNRILWRCPTAELVGLYDANVIANHLDAEIGIAQ